MLRHGPIWSMIAILSVGVACGESTGPDGISGTYALETVDGLDLPTAIPVTTTCEVLLSPVVCAETVRLEVREGTVLLASDSSYRIQTILRRQRPGGTETQVTSNLVGDWSLVGGQVALVDDEGVERTGTVAGGTITIDVVEDMSWVYRK